jgi:hypothetical protein
VLRLLAVCALAALPLHAQEPEAEADCRLAGLRNGRVRVAAETVSVLDGEAVIAQGRYRKDGLLDKDGRGVGPEAYNAAKGEIACGGAEIRLSWQMPYAARAYTVTLRFQGRGKRLAVGAVQSFDPSADALRRAEQKLAAGKVLEAIAEFDTLQYPDHYMDGGQWSERILDAAYQQAQAAYRAKDAKGAAELMEAAFEFAETFDGQRAPSDPKRRILLRNEYGFYLAEAGRNEEAEPVLAGVVAQAPERAAARLNLGDVQWAQGKKDAACVQYAAYAALRSGAAWPPRLAERCPALSPPSGSTGPR